MLPDRPASRQLVHRALTVALALVALSGCKENYGAGKPLRASDAGFEYQTEPRVVSSEPDTGIGPRLELVVGRVGGEGALDGVGSEARMGQLAGGACRGRLLFASDEKSGGFRRVDLDSLAVSAIHLHWATPVPFDLQPSQVASDGAGRLFVSDRIHHVIAEVSISDSSAKIVAGTPAVRGHQDGPASQATFDSPTGLAIGSGGELYVADTGNHAVRRVDVQAGTVRTIAQGFHAIWALAWAGDPVQGFGLFATDPLVDAIVHIDVATGRTDTIAGGNHSGLVGFKDGIGQKARFWRPSGLAYVGSESALYVADKDNSLVRRIDIRTKEVTTVAGRPLRAMHEDGVGEASAFFNLGFLTTCGDELLAGDGPAVRRIDTKEGRVTTIAGMPPRSFVRDGALAMAQLSTPEDGILLDSSTMLVAECNGSVVRSIDLRHGGVTTIAGFPFGRGFVDDDAPDARFSCPSALAYDGKSTVFIADRDNHAIRALDLNTHFVSTVAGTVSICGATDGTFANATLCSPSGLAFANGVLYVSDSGNHTIRAFDVRARTVTTLSGSPFERGATDGPGNQTKFSAPRHLIVLPDGSLMVADRENGRIRRIDAHNGATSIVCPNAHFERPRSISLMHDRLLISDGAAVHALNPTTCIDQIAIGSPPSVGLQLGPLPRSLNEPAAVQYAEATDSIVIVDRLENAVVRVTSASEVVK